MKIVHTYIRNMGITQEGKTNTTKLLSLDRWGLTSLKKLGHDVTLVCGGLTGAKKKKEYFCKGIRIIELPIRKEFSPTSRIIKGLAKELMNIEADVFHAHHYGLFVPETTAIIGKIRKIPTFMTTHNTFNEMKGVRLLIQKSYVVFMQPFLQLFDGIFFISNFIKNSKNFALVKKKRKILLRNYVPNPPVIDIERKKNAILYVGGVKYVKGVDLLIKAFNNIKIPNLKLNIVGSYKDHPEYQKYLTTLIKRDNVKFHGTLFGKEKWEQFYSNTILVVPSRKECFCNVVIEGMACEIPVIVSNGEALPETQGGHGLVFNLKNVSDLTKKLTLLLENKELREKIVKEGKEYSKNFTHDKIGKEMINSYTKAIMAKKS
ncbi:glycosyltransferase family 4 protein [Candidatus Woesearchaeota archaeon]|nr:glycosyltransferase family 4 protein [Candidatus Woesearchaeota archaeon]MBT5739750.1 glycosyltransferase family 4 protein [Candidatus Woesearchaeota archaeon]